MAIKEYTYLNTSSFITVIGVIIVILVIFKIVRDVMQMTYNKEEKQNHLGKCQCVLIISKL